MSTVPRHRLPRAMLRKAALLLLPLWCAAALAQSGDPLQSPDCRKAMAALDAEQAASGTAPAVPKVAVPAPRGASAPALPPRLAALRRAAARACLGSRADVPPPRAAQLPPAVQGPRTVPPPTALPPLPAVPRIPPPSAPARPSFVTSCDAGGCWTSDGTRLQRAGPNLIGPGGFCTQHGATVQCP